MLVAERHRKIVELVNERKSVRVSELSQLFSVTEETIRRDLEKLEQEQLLARSHGGAVSIQEDERERSYVEREILNAEEKQAIAVEAVKLIQPGDKIVLDASTTAWYMAKVLPNQPLTVVTNSIQVALELSQKDQISVISTGGILSVPSLSYIGPLANRSLKMYHVHKAFISCKGIDLVGGITDSNESQALFRQEILTVSDKTILLVDSSKFSIKTFVQICSVGEVDEIVTDEGLNDDEFNRYAGLPTPIKRVPINSLY
ncbi:DeoR/GlpR family DNA-binding transcription regulator [Pullulanibacillus sp. KACC 23026]|uniref:DeoR/GlpR family DNA-binding transcription regulator n=1 Tax=Pullulanibacillus sp. KACC 23026 TaxID=3028315 RepID=UPI0023B0185F|nr:DeoR/GlpR family DNA-binding transcription regulator [Pullulanibacillus sp. KACC 23026]WEG11822.1 DeoR/GlpR family DNA-binding transcription regulator [Pullulanibacillus sp. KACC 23026]